MNVSFLYEKNKHLANILQMHSYGKQNYMMANGEVSAGTVINIRNVNFGGLDLNSVRASVVHN